MEFMPLAPEKAALISETVTRVARHLAGKDYSCDTQLGLRAKDWNINELMTTGKTIILSKEARARASTDPLPIDENRHTQLVFKDKYLETQIDSGGRDERDVPSRMTAESRDAFYTRLVKLDDRVHKLSDLALKNGLNPQHTLKLLERVTVKQAIGRGAIVANYSREFGSFIGVDMTAVIQQPEIFKTLMDEIEKPKTPRGLSRRGAIVVGGASLATGGGLAFGLPDSVPRGARIAAGVAGAGGAGLAAANTARVDSAPPEPPMTHPQHWNELFHKLRNQMGIPFNPAAEPYPNAPQTSTVTR